MKTILVLFALPILLLQACNLPGDGFIDLKASIKRSDTQIIIQNNDSFVYQNLVIEINKEYKTKYPSLSPGEVLEVGLLQFTDDNHDKFNPFTKVASNITITCDIPDGKRGFIYGEID